MADQPQENKLVHPCFPQPTDGAERVWRYLDLAKFIWLLENQKLYLSRLDLLNDPHEGSVSPLGAAIRGQQLRQLGGDQLATQFSQIMQQNRLSLFVNCWHLGNAESEAMWRLYCPGNNGVAIQTTYAKLVQSADSDPFLYVGCVTYIDYESQVFPSNNSLYPVMHKRISFAHEKEVRLVKSLSSLQGLTPTPSPPGMMVGWPVEPTIEAIYVNPYAPEYYYDVVRAIVRRIIPVLESRVLWSKMRAAPAY